MSQVINQTTNEMTVQWTGITQAAPSGDYVDIGSWLISSVDWEGTPGATPTLQLQGSNATTPPAGASTALSQYTASATGLIAGNPNACRFIRPALSAGGDGTTNISCTVYFVR